MIRNIKALGLAFVAVAAMSMVVASAAQASQLHAATSGSAVITGEQTEQHNFKLTASGAETKCTQAIFEATAQEESSGGQTTDKELQITPTYTGCKTAGLNSQVLLNGCRYTLTNASPTAAATANIDVVCPSEKVIEIKLTGCTVTVGAQGPLSHLTFSNDTAPTPDHVTANITVSGIQYQFHGIACPSPPAVTVNANDGVYTGKATFKAYVDNGVGGSITHNGDQYNTLAEGNQVALVAT